MKPIYRGAQQARPESLLLDEGVHIEDLKRGRAMIVGNDDSRNNLHAARLEQGFARLAKTFEHSVGVCFRIGLPPEKWSSLMYGFAP